MPCRSKGAGEGVKMSWQQMSKTDMEIVLTKAFHKSEVSLSWDEQQLLEAYNRLYQPIINFSGKGRSYIS